MVVVVVLSEGRNSIQRWDVSSSVKVLPRTDHGQDA